MQAGAAEAPVLDQHRVEAEFAGADRRDIAAGAAADDENLAAKLGHDLVTSSGFPSPAANAGSRRRSETPGEWSRRRWIPAFAGMTIVTHR